MILTAMTMAAVRVTSIRLGYTARGAELELYWSSNSIARPLPHVGCVAPTPTWAGAGTATARPLPHARAKYGCAARSDFVYDSLPAPPGWWSIAVAAGYALCKSVLC